MVMVASVPRSTLRSTSVEEEPEERNVALEFGPQSTVADAALLKNPTTSDPCRAAVQPAGRVAEDTSVILMGEVADVN